LIRRFHFVSMEELIEERRSLVRRLF
jgi:hypothetical protein